MAKVIDRNKNGDLVLPRELVDAVTPHERFEVDVQGNVLIARPVQDGVVADVEHLQQEARRFWAEATPAERAREFRQWARSLKPRARHLPDEALRRENLYD